MKTKLFVTWCAVAVVVTAAWAAGAQTAPATRPSTSRPAASRPASARAVATAAASEANRVSSQAAGTNALESRRVSRREDGRGPGGWLRDWLQPLAALAVVIALIFVLRAVLKGLGGRGRGVGRTDVVEVLHRTRLAARCEVCLVRLGDRLLLVGLGAGAPVTLCEIRDEHEVQAVLAKLPHSSDPGAAGSTLKEVAQKIRSRLSSNTKVQD